jgi:hypothetical protein
MRPHHNLTRVLNIVGVPALLEAAGTRMVTLTEMGMAAQDGL